MEGAVSLLFTTTIPIRKRWRGVMGSERGLVWGRLLLQGVNMIFFPESYAKGFSDLKKIHNNTSESGKLTNY